MSHYWNGALADIKLEGSDISRLHALVVPRPDARLELRDRCSQTGTFVTERGGRIRLVPQMERRKVAGGGATLAVGEKFYIGKYRVEVCCEEVLGEPTICEDFIEREDETTEVNKSSDL